MRVINLKFDFANFESCSERDVFSLSSYYSLKEIKVRCEKDEILNLEKFK